MSQAHPTVEPEQTKTDTFAVYADTLPNMELVATVEVPRYSQPTADGVELDREKRLALAVARAVEREDTMIPKGDDRIKRYDHTADDGQPFYVGDEVGEMQYVPYEQNPAFDGVWNPEEDDD